VVLIVILVAAFARKGGLEGFYTEYAEEEPTRSWVPYTGTIPYGEWGNLPWAEMHPHPSNGKCCDTNLRDIQVGLDFMPVCRTCRS